MMDAVIRRYAGMPAPRYTSYPTALEFTAAVGPAEKAHWLETLDHRAPASLYLHVPYCREICHYCGCATKMAIRKPVLANYQQLLETEIALTGQRLLRPPRVARLHWGGGTPTLLGADGLAAIIDALGRHFAFEPGLEHAIELDPRGVTPKLARSLARLGVNRVSLGVQDLNPDVQAAIGRVQPLAVVEAAFAALRAADMTKINVDLIYGLPKQTLDTVAATARQVVALAPNRIACYGYAHLPRRKRNQRLIDERALPAAFERFAQAQAFAHNFTEAGYEAIGIDHFATPDDSLAVAAREGRLGRNFQGYTDDAGATLIGFGASAISCLAQGFAQNSSETGPYAFALGRGQLPVVRGHRITEDDRTRGAIIRRLMCEFRVDLENYAAPGAFSDELALLRPMMADGFVSHTGHEIAMTPLGRPFVRLAAAVFDAFRQGASHRFSNAV
jgi:oxygen-independent coproporphyrinogen-3 oxidase